jgi:hypothetical protein
MLRAEGVQELPARALESLPLDSWPTALCYNDSKTTALCCGGLPFSLSADI